MCAYKKLNLCNLFARTIHYSCNNIKVTELIFMSLNAALSEVTAWCV